MVHATRLRRHHDRRGAPAKPWIFRQIAQYTASKEATGVGAYDIPTDQDRYRMIRTYFQMPWMKSPLEEAAEATRAASDYRLRSDRRDLRQAATPVGQDEAVRRLVHPRHPQRLQPAPAHLRARSGPRSPSPPSNPLHRTPRPARAGNPAHRKLPFSSLTPAA